MGARGDGATAAPGPVVNVRAGDNLQAALDRARPGDTLLLEAGATFRGTFNLPRKDGDAFITVRTSAPDKQLPAPGERIDPARHAALLPKLVSASRGAAALVATGGAHHFRFVCVEFGPVPGGENNIVVVGTGLERSAEELPHHIEFDRVYVHGDPAAVQRRGVALNGRAVKITNSHFSDIKRKGDESQAIAGWGGDGPFEITNNYIEAGGEGVLFGGSAAVLKIVPADIVVRDNHFNKPLAWRAEGWLVKNHFELKNARRVAVDHNLMTNNWGGGQDGTAVLFTVRDEEGVAPQATVEDVFFVNNTVRGAGGALNLLGAEGRGGHRLTIRNNLFDDIDDRKWGGRGQFMTVAQWDGLTVENNTIITTGNITSAYGKPTPGFVFRNNVVRWNDYGFHGADVGVGLRALDTFFPGAVVSHNAVVGGSPEHFRQRNLYPATLADLRFVDAAAGDYRPSADSPLRRAGWQGRDIGANPDERVPAV